MLFWLCEVYAQSMADYYRNPSGVFNSGFRTKMAVAFCTKVAVFYVPKWPWINLGIHRLFNASHQNGRGYFSSFWTGGGLL